MTEDLQQLAQLGETQKQKINQKHSDFSLLNFYNQSSEKVKKICLAAVLSTSVTGCSTMMSPTNIYTLEESNPETAQQINIQDEMDTKSFHEQLARLDTQSLINYEQGREYNVEDLDIPVYTVNSLTERFETGNLFSESDTFYLKNPYEDDRLIKVSNSTGSVLNSFNKLVSNMEPSMSMYNPQLFFGSKDGTKEMPELKINLNGFNTENPNSLFFKSTLFHELNHASLAQEIIVHGHNDSPLMSDMKFQTKRLLGVDLSEDEGFYTRKILESHSDVAAALSIKVSEDMNHQKFQQYLSNLIDIQANMEYSDDYLNDEHKSWNAYEALYEMHENNPTVFDDLKLEEIPFYSMSIAIDSGFRGNKMDYTVKSHLENIESLSDEQFLAQTKKHKSALDYIIENMGEENSTTKRIKENLQTAAEHRDLTLLAYELEYFTKKYFEEQSTSPKYEEKFKQEDVSYERGIQNLRASVKEKIDDIDTSSLKKETQNLFSTLEKDWELSRTPEEYRNSPLSKKNSP